MVSVLIVDDDTHICRALSRALRVHGYDSATAHGYDEAVERLEHKHFDVLLTDLRMGDKDGIALLSKVRDSRYSSRPILMSAYATALDSQRAMELGAVRVLCKPLETSTVVEAIERAVDSTTAYFGSIHGLLLVDLLQMFHYGRRTIALELLGNPSSLISLREGEIVDARHGDEHGEAALRAILRRPTGSLRTKSLNEIVPTIRREFQGLLLDMLRELDEESHARSSSVPRSTYPSTPAHVADHPGSQPPPSSRRAPVLASSVSPAPFDAACERVFSTVEQSRCCELIDLRTGALLGTHPQGRVAHPLQRQLAEWATHLYREMPRAQGAAGGSGGTELAPFDELQLTGVDTFHFAKALRPGYILLLATTSKGTNVGLAWSELRSAHAAVERDLGEYLALPATTGSSE